MTSVGSFHPIGGHVQLTRPGDAGAAPSSGELPHERHAVQLLGEIDMLIHELPERLRVPVTGAKTVRAKINVVYPFQVLLPGSETGLDRDCKAQAEQIRSVSVDRVSHKLGAVPPHLMLAVDDALRLHLTL